MRLGPDERTYMSHADALEWCGREGLRSYARQYMRHAEARDFPSPIRWGWALCLRVSPHASWFFAAVCVGLTWCSSPLLAHLATRKLQDVAVAALTCACVIAASLGGDWSLALAFAGLLTLKPEGAALAVPAIAWTAGQGTFTYAQVSGSCLMAGALVWACATAWIFRGEAWPLVKALLQKHDTAYGREHQRGMPHRLLVDLALVSPVWLFACVAMPGANHSPPAQAAALLVVAHALTPVRNVRTILAADLLMRAAVVAYAREAGGMAWGVVGLGLLVDFGVWRRMGAAGLYDTPTAELVRATCKG